MNYEAELESLKGGVNKLVWERDRVASSIAKVDSLLRVANRELHFTEEAQTIIRKVAVQTQEGIRLHISDLVTVAIQSILPEAHHYNFNVTLEEKRGNVECSFSLSRGGNERDVFAVGGGVVDIVSMALRLSVWAISNTRATIILDEPFRNLSRNLHEKASALLKQLSEELRLQLIVVSHSGELIASADRVIRVERGATHSTVSLDQQQTGKSAGKSRSFSRLKRPIS